MKYEEKQKAIKLREKGESIKQIARILGVSKASVSVWVRKVVMTPKQKERLILNNKSRAVVEKRRDSRIKHEEAKRQIIIDKAGKDIKAISVSELKIIGIIFYWAEGGKTKRGLVRVANSDPNVIKIMMRFFREVCEVKELKFRGHIHTHSHLNIQNSLNYWSDITSIPISQFHKTYAKPSIASKGKRDSLPFGTLDVIICDTNLFLRIMGWIEKIKKLTVI
jgi:predicted transcriptional regulator